MVGNRGNTISTCKNAYCLLTVDVNKLTVDDVIGEVDSLAAVPATVFAEQDRDLVVHVVAVRGDGVHRFFIV